MWWPRLRDGHLRHDAGHLILNRTAIPLTCQKRCGIASSGTMQANSAKIEPPLELIVDAGAEYIVVEDADEEVSRHTPGKSVQVLR